MPGTKKKIAKHLKDLDKLRKKSRTVLHVLQENRGTLQNKTGEDVTSGNRTNLLITDYDNKLDVFTKKLQEVSKKLAQFKEGTAAGPTQQDLQELAAASQDLQNVFTTSITKIKIGTEPDLSHIPTTGAYPNDTIEDDSIEHTFAVLENPPNENLLAPLEALERELVDAKVKLDELYFDGKLANARDLNIKYAALKNEKNERDLNPGRIATLEGELKELEKAHQQDSQRVYLEKLNVLNAEIKKVQDQKVIFQEKIDALDLEVDSSAADTPIATDDVATITNGIADADTRLRREGATGQLNAVYAEDSSFNRNPAYRPELTTLTLEWKEAERLIKRLNTFLGETNKSVANRNSANKLNIEELSMAVKGIEQRLEQYRTAANAKMLASTSEKEKKKLADEIAIIDAQAKVFKKIKSNVAEIRHPRPEFSTYGTSTSFVRSFTTLGDAHQAAVSFLANPLDIKDQKKAFGISNSVTRLDEAEAAKFIVHAETFNGKELSGGTHEKIKIATVQSYDRASNTLRSSFLLTEDDIKKFKALSDQGWPGPLATKIPHNTIMEWAELAVVRHLANRNSFEPLQLNIGEPPLELPKNAIKAIMIYCKENGIGVVPPPGIDIKIEDSHLELYRKSKENRVSAVTQTTGTSSQKEQAKVSSVTDHLIQNYRPSGRGPR